MVKMELICRTTDNTPTFVLLVNILFDP
jgi:hypothetical protein